MADLLIRLPLSDKEIADVFGLVDESVGERIIHKETKVSNLRKVARESLKRRLEGRQRRRR